MGDNKNEQLAPPTERDKAHSVAERMARKRRGEDAQNALDGRYRVTQAPPDTRGGGDVDRLLEALIEQHPERDPAKIK